MAYRLYFIHIASQSWHFITGLQKSVSQPIILHGTIENQRLVSLKMVMLAYIRTCVFVVMTALLVLRGDAFAQIENEKALLSTIKTTSENAMDDPFLIIDELATLAEVAADNGWTRGVVQSNISAMNIYLSIEDFAEIESMLAATKPLLEEINDPASDIRIEVLELNVLISQRSFEQAKDLQRSLISQAEVIEDPLLKADVYQQVGQSQIDTQAFTDSIENLIVAYNLYTKQGFNYGISSTLVTLANLYTSLDGFDMAIEYYQKAIKYIRSQGDKFGESIVLHNIASVYLEQKNCDKASQYASQSRQVAEALNDDIGAAWASMISAECLSIEAQWQDAIDIYQRLAPFFAEKKVVKMEINALHGIAQAAVHLDDIERAEASLGKAKQLQFSDFALSKQLKFLEVEAKLLFAKENYLAAYQTQASMLDLQTRIYQQQNNNNIQRNRLRFDTEMKEAENELLVKQNQLNETRIAEKDRQNMLFRIMLTVSLVLLMLVIGFAISQFKLRKKFKNLSFEDPLTKSKNRRSILQFAKLMFENAKKTDTGFTIMLIDLDRFKLVNDTYGHDVGDNVLKAFADACQKSLRQTDAFGRYGGEEWLVSLPCDDSEIIHTLFERIQREFAAISIKGLEPSHNITFSMGVVTFNNSKHQDEKSANKRQKRLSLNKLIAQADALLYQAKEDGRNRYYLKSAR